MLHRASTHVNNHVIQSWEVADEAARLALVVTPDDIGRVALQLDTEVFYLLMSIAPVWQELGASGSGGGGTSTLEVKNDSGSTIAAGSVVYIFSAVDAYPTIRKAQANLSTIGRHAIGMTTTDILTGAVGTIVLRGEVSNIDTSGFTAGDIIYLSATTAGAFTTELVGELADYPVFLGYVTSVDAVLGKVVLLIRDGYTLDQIQDVALVTPLANGQVLTYESGKWINRVAGADSIKELRLVASGVMNAYKVVVANVYLGEVAASYADAATLAHAGRVVGILATATAFFGDLAKVVTTGKLTNVGWSWTAGQELYVGLAGDIVTTQEGVFSTPIGFAIDATTIFVNIGTTIIRS